MQVLVIGHSGMLELEGIRISSDLVEKDLPGLGYASGL
jgi:hypothetical protein